MVSIVLFKNSYSEIKSLLNSFIDCNIALKIYLIDNSPTDSLASTAVLDSRCTYIKNPDGNNGFGAGHNVAIRLSQNYDYHLVVNPDVTFDSQILEELLSFMDENLDIGLISPKILSNNGSIQYLCKRYPSVFQLFLRRFSPQILQNLLKNYMNFYEMRETGYDKIMNVTYLSGCFMLFRRKYLEEICYFNKNTSVYFDENIFMYFEDTDITIRMFKKYKCIFYPYVSIYHGWQRGSYNSLKLMWITIQSAFYFFNKHGWKWF